MKNTLMDLNNHLFAELERLNDEELTEDALEKEIRRADAIAKVATQVVNNAKTAFEATKLQVEYGLGKRDIQLPPMLENKDANR